MSCIETIWLHTQCTHTGCVGDKGSNMDAGARVPEADFENSYMSNRPMETLSPFYQIAYVAGRILDNKLSIKDGPNRAFKIKRLMLAIWTKYRQALVLRSKIRHQMIYKTERCVNTHLLVVVRY